ncbi:FecR family protein [Niabella aquatica]
MPHIHQLLRKFALGTCSRKEFDELMQLLNKKEHEQEIKSALKEIFASLGTEVFSDIQVNKLGDIIESGKMIHKPEKSIFFSRKIAASIAILLLISSSVYFFFVNGYFRNSGTLNITQISTQAESTTNLILPDGSKVWLNSYSTITYNTGFNDGKREVTLVGEALFDVKHDSLHPFIVHTKNFDAIDMGTVFNIKSYPEDATAVASLISGSVEVMFKEKQREKIVLVPNQKIIVQNNPKIKPNSDDKQLLVKASILPDPQTNIMPDTAWMAKKMIFKDITFYDLALQMQRRYSVKITFNKAEIEEYRFTGRFEDETLEEALQVLQAIAPFHYNRHKDYVSIER